KAESSLSQLAGQVTAVSQMISDKSRRRTPAAIKQGDAFARLQRDVRRDLARLERTGSDDTAHAEPLAKSFKSASTKRPIVQFHVGARDLFAFVHYRGECRAHRYLDGVETVQNLVALWRFMVERAPAERQPSRDDLNAETDILRRLGRWLLPPLELPAAADSLLILPEGQLACLPWMAMRQNGTPLVDRFAITFAPSLRHHLQAEKQTTRSAKAKIFVGASEDLTHLRKEIETVSSRLQGQHTALYDPCRRADWPDHSSARIWHFTGHAHLRSDNPFYSALLLADGPLFAADFRLKRNRVELITLAACRTGQQTSLPGEEAGGLVRSLLEMGAHNVIASHWAV
ncbi:MAG: CHAT domain-containing protein, partial [candidate division Zixibacteria bacterium]|nr:CHAT domain-containing protein [candidate division Zixibacteria bacterium]